ncbi:hypothetical protein DICSQDRAFT_146014 [Dichomitus squalens LYAD-421 SS1]|uniref:uncharacterized protein n=1 Tax=Dichomitus squalens (strain LYAD-421) TaxID=732165 RepID=UPI00044130F6|nr:uncharacterized protein DICSQDRAFT_146014 [Dichomitus squalens LYAD-421 SS1]EJF63040.1 hypothetical protein DICSQDRAFT_146014 [Dichomitus squalens LYAD-421 SS1]
MFCRSCMSNVSAASSSSRTRALATTALRLAHTHALRHSSLLTHSRPSSRTPAHHHQQAGPSSQAREAFHTRSAAFSTTARRGADELPRENLQAIFEQQQQRFLKLLQEKPEVEEHIRGFVQLLKDNGVDVSSGQMPSKLDMFQLMMKKEIRESATCMATTLQEAGIDLRNPEMMQSLMTMQSISRGNK